ncbi:SET domain-containing protein-lysine N-methyltransferase [Mangrovimicrobium sediminis]|uniref:SET domain-containing protein-lysine N-methyltransferase n=1 Tax=Mangrovimicrobium sediminis TaxID=2562682 RepID=A0A4Z0M1T3_9GAMM|nr:SET domain-containing protein [Haliea sp. SAOS-164]TGD73489.1 SET domain-containing protein-lysine N-methyltransferase [Haliea sp. SAOS-164]
MGLKKKLVVKKSKIHGKGLYTGIALKKGTLLGRCDSKLVKKPTPYTLWLTDDKLADVTCKLKYINHHKSPNVAYYDDLSVVALRDIKAGEELTHDYGEDWA